MRRGRARTRATALALLLGLVGAGVHAELAAEPTGRVEVLPARFGAHWVWVSDALFERVSLLDLDTGAFLGQVDGGYGVSSLEFGRTRREIYLPAIYYSRGTRGVRTDVVTIYDAHSLAPVDEVVLPPKRAVNPLPMGNAAVSDDGRFLSVFNMSPATSLSIVDLEARKRVGEVDAPGCGLVYATGRRRFAMLCADGSLLDLQLDDGGRVLRKRRTERFFDPERDPVTEKAVRAGDRWIFASFEGVAHVADFSGDEVRFDEAWSLFDDDERAAGWRIGGSQHLALHAATGRLYSAVHQGGADTHKEGGSEVWVYDLATHERVQRIELANTGLTVMGMSLEFGRDWPWPFDGLYGFLLDHVLPVFPVEYIAVTQDAEPILVTATSFSGSLGVYDAVRGELLRRVVSGNMTVQGLAPSPFRGDALAADAQAPPGSAQPARAAAFAMQEER